MKKIILLSIAAIGLNVSAQSAPDSSSQTGLTAKISSVIKSRYLEIGTSRQFAQDFLTIKASLDLNGELEIHSLVQTGNGFNNDFNNFYDFKKDSFTKLDDVTKLYMKQLYLKKNMASGKLIVAAGAMTATESIGMVNALSSVGWVDGVRAQIKSRIGDISLNAGQIKSTDSNFAHRFDNYSVNYFEISLKRSAFENLLIEVGVQRLNGKDFIQVASKYDIKLATDKVIHLFSEAKLEADNNQAYKVAVGFQDILSLFNTPLNKAKLSMNYEYVSKAYDTEIRKLSSGIHTGYDGGAVVTKLQVPLSKKLGLSANTNVRFGSDLSDFRFEGGITKSIFDKVLKTKNK